MSNQNKISEIVNFWFIVYNKITCNRWRDEWLCPGPMQQAMLRCELIDLGRL